MTKDTAGITCSKSTMETQEQRGQFVQINNKDTRTTQLRIVNFEHI